MVFNYFILVIFRIYKLLEKIVILVIKVYLDIIIEDDGGFFIVNKKDIINNVKEWYICILVFVWKILREYWFSLFFKVWVVKELVIIDRFFNIDVIIKKIFEIFVINCVLFYVVNKE